MIGVRKNHALKPTSTRTLVSRKNTLRDDRMKPRPARKMACVRINNGSQNRFPVKQTNAHELPIGGPADSGLNKKTNTKRAGSDSRKLIMLDNTMETGNISRGK